MNVKGSTVALRRIELLGFLVVTGDLEGTVRVVCPRCDATILCTHSWSRALHHADLDHCRRHRALEDERSPVRARFARGTPGGRHFEREEKTA